MTSYEVAKIIEGWDECQMAILRNNNFNEIKTGKNEMRIFKMYFLFCSHQNNAILTFSSKKNDKTKEDLILIFTSCFF